MIKPIFIMSTCKGREAMANYVISNIPNLIVNFDDFKDSGRFISTAWQNQQRMWLLAQDRPVVYLEDDIILCDNFVQRITQAINERPLDVIQFFSMRKDDLTIGSRYITGSQWMMNQCYYFPAGLSSGLYLFSKAYERQKELDPNVPTDPCIGKYLQSKKLRYWNHVPNLVDHRVAKSMIRSSRSSKRQSLTFKK